MAVENSILSTFEAPNFSILSRPVAIILPLPSPGPRSPRFASTFGAAFGSTPSLPPSLQHRCDVTPQPRHDSRTGRAQWNPVRERWPTRRAVIS
ncbi:hypothetical protein D9619_009523 [Psilocybe cf. subviscida]|uniref:Uncharacterized protein n=1 Tax=Psilocybe cf. subviscida TaxID=2480587 RepID=A0A8H5BLA0_9AGAR|nr:hypothetical protein D9619_009523 [Psilocybe cf. subviscida]